MNRAPCTAIAFAFFSDLLITASLLGVEPDGPKVWVEPRETDELLANPGMGWQTFHKFADEDKNLAGLPSGSAYFRFYWREIEPQNGHIDFAKFDALLAHARSAGQKLAFRVMCTGSGEYMDAPGWLKEQGCPGVEFNLRVTQTLGAGLHHRTFSTNTLSADKRTRSPLRWSSGPGLGGHWIGRSLGRVAHERHKPRYWQACATAAFGNAHGHYRCLVPCFSQDQ